MSNLRYHHFLSGTSFFGGSHLCLGTNCFDHLLKTLFLTSFRDRAIELDINTSEIIKLTVDKWIDH